MRSPLESEHPPHQRPATSIPLAQVCGSYPAYVTAMRGLVCGLTQDMRDVSLLAGPTTRAQSLRHDLYDVACTIANGYWGGGSRRGFGMQLYGSYATATAVNTSNVNATLLAHPSTPMQEIDLWALGDAMEARPGVHVERVHSATLPRIVCTLRGSVDDDHTSLQRDAQSNHGASVVTSKGLTVVFTINQLRGVRHAEFLAAFIATYPAFHPLLMTLKALHRELSVPDEEMSSVVLTWTAVAFYLHHVASVGGHASSPGQALIAFLHFFQTDGAFDPRRHVLQPGHAVGIFERSVPSSLSAWVLVDPIQLPSPAVSAVGDGGGRVDAHRSMAVGCYLIHRLRDKLTVVLRRIVDNYSRHDGGDALATLMQPLPKPVPRTEGVVLARRHRGRHAAPTDVEAARPNSPKSPRRSPNQTHLLQLLFPNLLHRLAAERASTMVRASSTEQDAAPPCGAWKPPTASAAATLHHTSRPLQDVTINNTTTTHVAQ